MDLGKRISRLRKQNGMTQEQLAIHLKTNRQAISKWESGKSEPDLSSLIQMGNLFSVSMDYLIRGEKDYPTPIVPDEPERMTCETAPDRTGKNWCFGVLLVIGCCLILLLPLFASLYQSFCLDNHGSAYTNEFEYLLKWPLLGVVLIAVGLCLTGWFGFVKVNRNKKS